MVGMTAHTDHFTVRRDGVTIAASRGGSGRPLVLCPGLLTTQADLHELITSLRRDHDVVAFDLRGHGDSAAADRYSFESFLDDLTAVLAHVNRLDPTGRPILVGHSLGADLIVHYTAAHPGTVAGLVLVDGANPVPEPFITAADLPEFRALFASLVREGEAGAPTVRLTGREILDLNLEVEKVRTEILDRFRVIDCPISMIMSTSMAGDSDTERAAWRNRNWQAGIRRLVREQPHIGVRWLAAGHGSVRTHAREIARIIRDMPEPAGNT